MSANILQGGTGQLGASGSLVVSLMAEIVSLSEFCSSIPMNFTMPSAKACCSWEGSVGLLGFVGAAPPAGATGVISVIANVSLQAVSAGRHKPTVSGIFKSILPKHLFCCVYSSQAVVRASLELYGNCNLLTEEPRNTTTGFCSSGSCFTTFSDARAVVACCTIVTNRGGPETMAMSDPTAGLT